MSAPDYTSGIYADTGCAVAPKCVECPLAECRYERPYVDAGERLERDREIVRLRESGLLVRQIAAQMGVSDSTVFRALRHGELGELDAVPAWDALKPVGVRAPLPYPELRRAA